MRASFKLTCLKRVAGPSANSVSIEIPPPRHGEVSPLEDFAPHAQFVEWRRINWEQTFARKGLPLTAYTLQSREDCFGSHTFTFRCKVRDLKLPLSVRLTRSGDETLTLQGDVLTTAYQTLAVFAEPEFEIRDFLPPAAFTRFGRNEWIRDTQRLNLLYLLCHGEHQDTLQGFLSNKWDNSLSVARVTWHP